MRVERLTALEIPALSGHYNLSDGHWRQISAEQHRVLDRSSELYKYVAVNSQEAIEAAFASSFFKLAGQHSHADLCPPIYFHSSSYAIEAVANYLRMTRQSVALMHPTFDSLFRTLQRQGVTVHVMEEPWLLSMTDSTVDADAIFVVLPNNPTGFILSECGLKDLIDYCKTRNKLLIIDFCFRFFSDYNMFDQYKMLHESGVSFIGLEDTGKTWPTDLKAGTMLTSKDLYEPLKDIADDFLQNVSAYIFALLTELLNIEQQFPVIAQSIVETNRAILRAKLRGTSLQVASTNSRIGVEWLHLSGGRNSVPLYLYLREHGLHVLPGAQFYWGDPYRGQKYIRIALGRPEPVFAEAMTKLREMILVYQHSRL